MVHIVGILINQYKIFKYYLGFKTYFIRIAWKSKISKTKILKHKNKHFKKESKYEYFYVFNTFPKEVHLKY